jgi:hypothetical protein
MTRWKGTRLDLGSLGTMLLNYSGVSGWWWEWNVAQTGVAFSLPKHYAAEASARRAAESWLRRALKQAARRLEVK